MELNFAEFSANPSSEVTDIECFGNGGLVFALVNGEIVHLPSKTREKLSLESAQWLLCANYKLGYVFGAGSKCVAFTLPDMTLVPKLGLHGIDWGVMINREIVVISSQAIRFLQIVMLPQPNVTVKKKLDIAGCQSIAGVGGVIGLATDDMYMLINGDDITPLFPIVAGLNPMIVGFKGEFLVVQGTSPTEAATGLIVDLHGEFSKCGVVLQWKSYPKQVLAWGKYVFALVGEDLIINYISEENVVHDLPVVENVAKVFKLKHQYMISDSVVHQKLGEVGDCLSGTKIAYTCHNSQTIHFFVPESKFVKLEGQLRTSTNLTYNGEHFNDKQKLYLKSLVTLRHIQLGNIEKAVSSCPTLDLALELNGMANNGTVFPGLVNLVDELKQDTPKSKQFLKVMLKHKLKLQSSNASTAQTKQFERLMISLLNDDEVCAVLLEPNLKSKGEIIADLHEHKKFGILEQYYSISGQSRELFRLWLVIINDTKSAEEDIKQATKSMVSFLTTNKDKKLFEEVKDKPLLLKSLVFVSSSPNIDQESGFKVLTSPAVDRLQEYEFICESLKNQTDQGELWRMYLKYLVHNKNMFKSDLLILVVSELLDLSVRHKEHITQSYTVYKSLVWPKPQFNAWLDSWALDASYPVALLDSQHDLWALMEDFSSTPSTNLQDLATVFDTNLSLMLYERTLLCQSLSLHTQVVDLLIEETDYMSLVYYPLVNNQLEGLSLSVLKRILSTNPPEPIITEYLTANECTLDLESVINEIDSEIMFSTIAQFASQKLQDLELERTHDLLVYNLSKSALRTLNMELE